MDRHPGPGAMSEKNTEQLAARIGAAIRARRKEARLTLTQVARRADISVSHLSNLENGLSIASLPLLAKVASALQASLAELTRDEDRLVVQTSSLPSAEEGWCELSHQELQTRIMAGEFDAGDRPDLPLPLQDRDFFLTVITGAIEVIIDGTSYTLERGDAIDARSVLSASLTVIENAQVLCSTTPSSRA